MLYRDQRFATVILLENAVTDSPRGGQQGYYSTKHVDTSVQCIRWGKGRINEVTWSPDGLMLAAASSLGIYLYDSQTLTEQRWIETDQPISQVAFVGGSEILATLSDELVSLWWSHNGESFHTMRLKCPSASTTFTADGELVALDTGIAIDVLQVRDGAPLYQLPEYTAGTYGSLAFTHDKQIAAIIADGTVQLRRLEDGELLLTLGEGASQSIGVVFAPDDQTLATISDTHIQLWRVADGVLLHTIENSVSCKARIAFAPDGRTLAATSDKGIRIWRVGDGSFLRVLKDPNANARSIAFSPDGRTLAAASDVALQLWDVQTGELLHNLLEFSGGINSLAFAPDSESLAIMSGSVLLRRADDSTLLGTFESHPRQANSLAFTPDGSVLAVASSEKIQLWDSQQQSLLCSLDGQLAQAEGIAFSMDGQTLHTVSPQGIQIWRVMDGAPLGTLNKCTAGAYDVALVPDSRWLATVVDHTVRLWRVEDETLLCSIDIDLDINSIALGMDGSSLAVASDEAIQVWHVDRHNRPEQWYMLEACAQRCTFAPNNQIFASTWDKLIQVWRVRDGALLHTLEGHTDIVHSLAFAPDSRSLISGGRDGTIRQWIFSEM